MPDRKEGMTKQSTFQSVIPPTPAEVAVAAARWEQRGILGRLVRLDEVAPAGERRRAGRTTRPVVAPASRSF